MEEIWQRYFQTREVGLRDILIQEYLPLVKQVAGRMALGLPSHVEEEELMACGIVGLLEAVERYNPSSAASFKTFATWRIRGAMLDELRRITWMPRSIYQRLRQLQEAEQRMSYKLGREPTVQELAAELCWSPEAVEQAYAQANCCSLVSLESLLFAPPAANSESGEELFISEGSWATPEESLEREERQEILARAIEELPPREKMILALYYKEELTLREIAQLLHVTAARVSQLHARCILNLREKLQKAGYLEK
jgi:RNA polymerase sigma factor for flagellar operon FliA